MGFAVLFFCAEDSTQNFALVRQALHHGTAEAPGDQIHPSSFGEMMDNSSIHPCRTKLKLNPEQAANLNFFFLS